jgi:flagellar M-ring protein FliF
MAERGSKIQQQLTTVVQRLTMAQKVMFGVVGLGVMLGIYLLVSLVNSPSYATLFNNLSPEDASKIVAKLKEKEIPYMLDNDGKSVLVPKPNVYDLRLTLAGEGLPQASTIGYEIFDRTNLGISDFVQKVNYRRALEGELARTILQLEEVEGARVHLVVPERTLFREDEKPTTASVVLKLKSGNPLRRETVDGITHLVASSVEGLTSGNVTIVDSRGELLSEQVKPNSVAALTATQYELQQNVEGYLAQKAQHLLESVVGPGNAIVQVNAELDFRQVERTLEQYDPEKTAIRSEQISEEKTANGDSSAPSTRNSSVTNYEVNKTVEHIVEGMGTIKRLSVATVVNAVPKTVTRDGVTTTEYIARPKDEMNSFTELVKKAVGFNPVRNDEVTVTNLSFGTSVPDQDFMYKTEPLGDWTQHVNKLLVVAAMIGGVVILWSLLGRLLKRVEIPTVETAYAAPATAIRGAPDALQLPHGDEDINPTIVVRNERRARVTEYIRERPDEGARLLKVWMAEE